MENKTTDKTNWYVVTGGPSTGKTTTINMLSDLGYQTTIEHARHFIDTMQIEGHTVEEIKSNKQKFQLGVLNMQIEQEAEISPNDMIFLDRAIPDALAYYRFLGLEEDKILTEALQHINYKKIFILDRLPLINDYARLESEGDQIKIHSLIAEVYNNLPFPVVTVPVMAPDERVEFILKHI